MIMIPSPPTMIVPLQTDKYGSIRVSGTRVTLDVVIARFHQGYSPEAIHQAFSSLPVNDIYAVISFYLAHRDELDAYLKHRDEEGERLRAEWEAAHTPKVTKAELLARLQAKRDSAKL